MDEADVGTFSQEADSSRPDLKAKIPPGFYMTPVEVENQPLFEVVIRAFNNLPPLEQEGLFKPEEEDVTAMLKESFDPPVAVLIVKKPAGKEPGEEPNKATYFMFLCSQNKQKRPVVIRGIAAFDGRLYLLTKDRPPKPGEAQEVANLIFQIIEEGEITFPEKCESYYRAAWPRPRVEIVDTPVWEGEYGKWEKEEVKQLQEAMGDLMEVAIREDRKIELPRDNTPLKTHLLERLKEKPDGLYWYDDVSPRPCPLCQAEKFAVIAKGEKRKSPEEKTFEERERWFLKAGPIIYVLPPAVLHLLEDHATEERLFSPEVCGKIMEVWRKTTRKPENKEEPTDPTN